MDPVTIGLSLASLGMSVFGQVTGAQGSAEQVAAAQTNAAASKDIAQQEIEQDKVRRQSMELSAHRSSIQDIRNAQAARSRALTAASSNNPGAGGSALSGAYGGISGKLNEGLLTISNNLEMGERMFDLNTLINKDRMIQADASSRMATGQGQANLGKTITGVAGTVGNLAGAAGGGISKSFSSLFGGDTTGGMQSFFDEQSASTRQGEIP